MADTGAPHFIPFAEPTDLVRDWPALSEDVADAVADGLSAAGGLVAVKSAIFAGQQTASVTGSGNIAVNDIEITHEVADASNKLIISAFIGTLADTTQLANVGIAVHDGTGLIAVGPADGARTRVTASARMSAGFGSVVAFSPSVTFVHTPGAGSKTYTVRAINVSGDTQTIFINRFESDDDNALRSRPVSSLVIQEVKV